MSRLEYAKEIMTHQEHLDIEQQPTNRIGVSWIAQCMPSMERGAQFDIMAQWDESQGNPRDVPAVHRKLTFPGRFDEWLDRHKHPSQVGASMDFSGPSPPAVGRFGFIDAFWGGRDRCLGIWYNGLIRPL